MINITEGAQKMLDVIKHNRVTLWDLLCRMYFDEPYYDIVDPNKPINRPKWKFLYNNWNDVIAAESAPPGISLPKFEEKYKLKFKLTPVPEELA